MEIKHPEWLEIKTNESVIYGLNQEWFSTSVKRASGCGPTAASALLLYLNRRDSGLLPYQSSDIASAALTLEDVWNFITPGLNGVSSTKKFVKGMNLLLRHYEAPWICHEISIKKYGSVDKIASFIENGILSDCPVAFLNLHEGQTTIFEGWHWIVLVALKLENGRYIATGFDGGKKIDFDLEQWVSTTKKGGGFVYLT